MKNKLIYIMTIAALLTTSCSKFVEDYDISPNSPVEVSPNLLLTNAEVALFATYSGQLARTSSILTQQIAGTDAQMLDVENYRIFEGDNQNEWEVIYTDGLESCEDLITVYGADNSHYSGIAKIIKAMFFGLATDLWGDIPMSEALQGVENLNPAYDRQEKVIDEVQKLLTNGIADLSAAGKGLLPSGDDLVFQGDVSSWVKIANVLKARYALRINKVSNMGNSDALTFLNAAGMTGSMDNMNIQFGAGSTELNQWSAFETERPGYIRMGKHMIDLMNSSSDPRLPFYADTAAGGVYLGSGAGVGDANTSPIGGYLKRITLPMVSYVESKFIEAEAMLESSNTGGAATAYNEAVKASIVEVVGAPDATYEAANASETASSITLDKICTQRYIALFGQVEAYSSWRRTDLPNLTANPTGAINSIPVRLPTPLNERLYNSNATVVSNLTSHIWWDK